MTEGAVAELVARLFAAAGRNYGETHLEVYAEALATVPDDVGREASRNLARHVSWDRPPSVGLVMDEVQAILRNRQPLVPAIEEATGEPVSREKAMEWVERMRSEHGPGPLVDAMESVARRQPPEKHHG